VAGVFGRLNARVSGKFKEERGMLKELPARRSSDYEEVDARVTKFSTLSVKKVLYTVPSRLVGYRLKVRVYSETLECWLGSVCVLELRRGQPAATGTKRSRIVDYRHLLPALIRKPGALARSVLRDDLFPRTEYRLMWAHLKDVLPEKGACRLMVGLLDLSLFQRGVSAPGAVQTATSARGLSRSGAAVSGHPYAPPALIGGTPRYRGGDFFGLGASRRPTGSFQRRAQKNRKAPTPNQPKKPTRLTLAHSTTDRHSERRRPTTAPGSYLNWK